MTRTARSGRSHSFLATLLVMLGVLAGMAPGQRSVIPIDRPSYLQVEVLEAGLGACLATDDSARHVLSQGDGYFSLRALKVTYHFPFGLRAGISSGDAGGILRLAHDLPWGGSWAPIHIGYDIVLNPRRTAFFYGMVPSCYAEATLGAFPPYAKVAAACDIDYCGIGIGAEAGCLAWNNQPQFGPTPTPFRPAIYASLKLRLLDAAFRLPGQR